MKLPTKTFCGIDYGHTKWARHRSVCEVCKTEWQKLIEEDKRTKTKVIREFNCPICNKKLNRINNAHLKTHNLTIQQFEEKYPNFIRSESKITQQEHNDSFNDKLENIDFVICPICKQKYKQIDRTHLKKHNLTRQQFFSLYPDFKHVSEKASYKKNVYRNMTEEQHKKHKIIQSREGFLLRYGEVEGEKRYLLSKKRKGYSRTLKGYIEKFGEELGTKKYTEANIKRKNDLYTFQKKYGNEEGLRRYLEKGEQLSKSYNHSIVRFTKNYSKISQKLFWNIYNLIKNKYKKIYFGELNHEYSCNTPGRLFDFVIVDNKKAIEYNGEPFHARYIDKNWRQAFTKATAEESQKYDKDKIEAANKKGYSVLTVWDSDYKRDNNLILNQCLEFLES